MTDTKATDLSPEFEFEFQGKTYRIEPGFDVLKNFEEFSGTNCFGTIKYNVTTFVCLIAAGLREHFPKLSTKQLLNLVHAEFMNEPSVKLLEAPMRIARGIFGEARQDGEKKTTESPSPSTGSSSGQEPASSSE